jgi:O-antigen/teichoic acid export membrane protein
MILWWGIPLIPHLASTWIKQGGDRLIINEQHSLSDVGLFSFALNLTSIIIIIGSAFNATNSVSIYQTLSSKLPAADIRRKLKRQTKEITAIYLIAYLLIVLGASTFTPLLLPRYTPSIPYFLILSLQGLGQCFYFLYSNYLFYYHRNKQLMLVTFVTSVLHLLLSLLLTKYSLIYTCCIYVFVQAILVYSLYRLSNKALSDNLLQS